ncbi:diacylglycerol/lipid kinase family protein [Evansella halocellulosilytica]|uniref:diacylglycerol/lipid kinase family protein n=1 Tax=Evansella halocellulosilytica TaxID=2011013 RepID=UPI000BB8B71F|nr:diacylglycerol kinase family protein [Evansella halocellulosilytica]
MDKNRALIVYNPASGRKKNHKTFPFIKEALSKFGYHLTIHQLVTFSGYDPVIRNACRKKFNAIFIVGGDGTINFTIQTIAAERYRPPIGIIPFGTSNEFAQFLKIPSKIDRALSIIAKKSIRTIDIGKFGDKYFANIASAGWLSDITYETSPFLKSYLGEFAYILYFFKTFFTTKQADSISVKTVKHKHPFEDLSLFLIMKGNGVGPFERLIHQSDDNDGCFHLIICKNVNRFSFFIALVNKMLHLPLKQTVIQHLKVESASFTIPQHININLDGDKSSIKQYDFQVLPQFINVFTNSQNEP